MMHSITVLMQFMRVYQLYSEWRIDLPELISIRLGKSAFQFEDDEPNELIIRSEYDETNWWIDLPKLTSLTTTENSWAFYHPRAVTLEGVSYHSMLTNRHTLSQYRCSPLCIQGVESFVSQEYSQSERVLYRHWRIDEPSKHSETQPRCKCPFC